MSDVILRLSVREAHEVREVLRAEVERGINAAFSGGSFPLSARAARAFQYMVRLQDAIEDGRELHDKEGG